MDTVAKNITSLRMAAGMSQQRLADLLGVTRSAVSYYESGRISPKMAMLEKIAAVFDVSVADLVYDEAVYPVSDGITETEYKLLRAFRGLSAEKRARLLALVEAMG